jgi:hypothetical protein
MTITMRRTMTTKRKKRTLKATEVLLSAPKEPNEPGRVLLQSLQSQTKISSNRPLKPASQTRGSRVGLKRSLSLVTPLSWVTLKMGL